eukprot:1178311-Prorocentrum_minimum.AAC.2
MSELNLNSAFPLKWPLNYYQECHCLSSIYRPNSIPSSGCPVIRRTRTHLYASSVRGPVARGVVGAFLRVSRAKPERAANTPVLMRVGGCMASLSLWSHLTKV